MRLIRKLRDNYSSNLYAVMLTLFLFGFMLLGAFVGSVGYFAFITSYTKEYKESVYKSAQVAATYVTNMKHCERWNAVGPTVMSKMYDNYFLRMDEYYDSLDYMSRSDEEIYRDGFKFIGITDEDLSTVDKDTLIELNKENFDYEDLEKMDVKPGDDNYYSVMGSLIFPSVYDYCDMKANLLQLVESQGLSNAYIIIPDDDYKNFTIVLDCTNENSGYTEWELGSKHESTEYYIEPMRNIMEKGSQKEIVQVDENAVNDAPHVTAMIPVYNIEIDDKSETEVKEVAGILCVERYMSELYQAKTWFIQGVSAITVIFLIIITVIVILILKKNVIVPLGAVVEEAERFAHETTEMAGDKLQDNVGNIKEIKALAESIDKMEVDTIKHIDEITEMTKNQERIGYEISLASEIQQGMLPSKEQDLTEDSRYDVDALMHPAKNVGGDFFDFFLIDNDHLAILVADVSDKGVAAALFMATTKTLIQSRARLGGTASEIIAYADQLIGEKNPAGMFVTVWLGIVDLNTGHVNACNAGHDYPALMRADSGYTIEKVDHGPPIGFLPDMKFIEYDYDLAPGDRIFLYTDGLAEAKSDNGDRFGTDRMLEILNNNKNKNNNDIITIMLYEVNKFSGKEPQFDDITMMSFTYFGNHKGDSK